MMHKVYVYGTLRQHKPDTVRVPGKLYRLGWYPGAKMSEADQGDSSFVCEIREVDDDGLKIFDTYEGYRPDDPEGSLYIRRQYLDGWIYEYNGVVLPNQFIESGDWAKETEKAIYTIR